MARRRVHPLDKSVISRAVARNRNRGTIGSRDGQKVVPAVSPDPAKVAHSRELFRSHKQRSAEFSAFMERWKVDHSREFEKLEVARSTVERISKLALSEYRKERKLAAPERKKARSYNLLESSVNDGSPPPGESTDSVTLPNGAKAEEEVSANRPESLPAPLKLPAGRVSASPELDAVVHQLANHVGPTAKKARPTNADIEAVNEQTATEFHLVSNPPDNSWLEPMPLERPASGVSASRELDAEFSQLASHIGPTAKKVRATQADIEAIKEQQRRNQERREAIEASAIDFVPAK